MNLHNLYDHPEEKHKIVLQIVYYYLFIKLLSCEYNHEFTESI